MRALSPEAMNAMLETCRCRFGDLDLKGYLNGLQERRLPPPPQAAGKP